MEIFFDVDGVLIDGWHSNPELRKPWSLSMEADLGVNRAAFGRALFSPSGEGNDSLMSQCSTGKADLVQVLEQILPSLGYKGSTREFLDYWFTKDSNVSRPVLDVVKYLKTSGKCKLRIATGQEHHRASYLWNQLEFSRHFESMHYSAEIGYSKEDPRFYSAVNEQLTISGEGLPVFFDDSPAALSAARSQGWDAAQFNSVRDIYDHPRMEELLQGFVRS